MAGNTVSIEVLADVRNMVKGITDVNSKLGSVENLSLIHI